ncbi:MAG: hypothetical protein WBF90_17895 [Rivularia sp. (in: cyanobacteria)]|jgi:hypothetical protein
MGRWTPLILMAGGLAILLGTLLGINFPMDGRNAQAPTKGRQSQVLPANINVNSTATGANGSNSGSAAQSGQNTTAQNNNNTTTNRRVIQSAPTTTAQGNTSTTGSSSTAQSQSNTQRNTSGNRAPVRALW